MVIYSVRDIVLGDWTNRISHIVASSNQPAISRRHDVSVSRPPTMSPNEKDSCSVSVIPSAMLHIAYICAEIPKSQMQFGLLIFSQSVHQSSLVTR